ncbi:mannose-1-phosphate guanylyltransferase [Phycicoccus sp. HDW14]|uniref:mannose-1-phosphate guanylyltransferase n=1 Tax=Phycicoccus sp. HDW14 TaxID=2714941 RepID=UPI001407B92B|nr:mannose-1-phosphate guanylyltransferase [Phycicoccus sp. HDW14]QIM21546.1 mannose-1-phosphate guanylyltransferase [Phycicoccus sp. HDW14]
MPDVAGFWAVVPAGGAGTRLWPLSRAGHPKFLLDLTGSGRTLLQATVDRLAPLTVDRVVVVTGAAHAEAVRGQLPELDAGRVLAEPSPRDSMAAIGLAAAVVERSDPDAVIGSFAADHVIPDAAAFHTAVREAVEVARDGHLVTLGVEPTHPATGFGYIRAGERMDGFPTARHAVEFVEKPDAERATAYVASGEYRWNAGMFVVRASVLLDLLGRWHPELAAGLREVAADPSRLDAVWPHLTKIAIDHAVAEPAAAAGHVVVVPAPFGWDDVGDFASLASLLPATDGLTVLGSADDVTVVGGSGLVVTSGGRRVALVGLDDVVVVDTPDAVLVTTRARAQDVKRVVDALKDSGRTDLT